MKIKNAIVILFSVLIFFPNISHALRCGENLTIVGDIKHKVLLTCGEPKSKENIGYIDQVKEGNRIRVMKIEEWIIESTGKHYSLIFEGNKLVTIESAGSKNE